MGVLCEPSVPSQTPFGQGDVHQEMGPHHRRLGDRIFPWPLRGVDAG